VPPGNYTLRIAINYERAIPELSYDNNTVDVPVTVPGEAMPGDPLLACPSAMMGTGRDCGWSRAGAVRTCTPGLAVEVGCAARCTLGSCTGDSMLRICDGDVACTSRDAIAANDDFCSGAMPAACTCGTDTLCSYTTFTCPASGRYSVLTGSYASGSAYTCTLAVR
jgi:hypothetical protein